MIEKPARLSDAEIIGNFFDKASPLDLQGLKLHNSILAGLKEVAQAELDDCYQKMLDAFEPLIEKERSLYYDRGYAQAVKDNQEIIGDREAFWQQKLKEAKDALDAARAAILDAIYRENGLDGYTGSAVMEWITDILGDEKEYRPTIEGVSSQTQIAEDKAFLHRDHLLKGAKAEVAREIFKEIEKHRVEITVDKLAFCGIIKESETKFHGIADPDYQELKSKYTEGKE